MASLRLAPTLGPVKKRGRWKAYLAVTAGLVVVVVSLVGIKGAQIGKLMAMGKQMQQAGPPPEAVASAVAQAQTWDKTVEAVGSISGLRSVSVSNEVPGTVTKILFESGGVVREGQPLIELDAQVERAQLASAEARRDLAQRTLERSRKLLAGQAISAAQLDETEAQLKASSTDVAALRAQLAKKVIRAPFKGRLGIRAVNVGQYLNPGTTVTTLDAVGGTFVDFSLPQEQLAAVTVGLPVQVTLEETKEQVRGTISAIDPTIDPVTRNVKIRGAIPNLASNPRPGMFVKVEVIKPSKDKVVIVPATSLIHASYGDSLFVIEDKKPGSPGMTQTPNGKPVKTARQQFVRTGITRGDFVEIVKGVQPGQEVVSAGAFKLRNNASVVVDNSVQPTPQQDPHPENR